MACTWDFSKLPEEEYSTVIDHYNNARWVELAKIHDKYQLSCYDYCCCLDGIRAYFKKAIDDGIIK